MHYNAGRLSHAAFIIASFTEMEDAETSSISSIEFGDSFLKESEDMSADVEYWSTVAAPASSDKSDMGETFTYIHFKRAIDIYVVGILCLLGISANIMTVMVLGRDRSIRHTTGFLLQALAATDAAYLTTCIFYQTLNCIEGYTDWIPSMTKHWPLIEPYVWPFASIAQTSAVWLVVVVTADRYIAICNPLHAAHISTKTRMRKAVVIIWIFSICYNLPRFFERKVVEVYEPSCNCTKLEVQKTALRNDPLYIAVYKTSLFFVVRFLLPLSSVAFFNTRLIQAIKDSYRLHERSRDYYKKERYTLTLVVVVIVFAICETPDFMLRVWMTIHQYVPSLPYDLTTLRYINIISNLFLAINSCINFFIYCFMGQKFRLILMRMLCGKQPPPSEVYTHFRTTIHATGTERMEEMTVLVRTSAAERM